MYTNGHIESCKIYTLSEQGLSYKLAANFTLGEVACKDDRGDGPSDVVIIHPMLMAGAQALRTRVSQEYGSDVSLTVNSAYRTWAHHQKIYEDLGEPVRKGSAHLFGMALDLTCKDLELLRREAEKLNPGGLGFYNTFIHFDIVGAHRRWDYRTTA